LHIKGRNPGAFCITWDVPLRRSIRLIRVTMTTTHQLYVNNLPSTFTQSQLSQMFANFSTVATVGIFKDASSKCVPAW
jgi:hypothetical protein